MQTVSIYRANQKAVHTQNEAEMVQVGFWLVGGDSSA